MALISDLSIVKVVDNSVPSVGDNITFTITAANAGPSDDTLVSVTDVIPSGYSIVSATPTVGSWVSPTWTIGNFLSGATETLTIVATVLSSGEYTNTATISGNNTDPDPNNNTSTVAVTPPPASGFCNASVVINPNFFITYPLAAGTTIQYQIGITPITGLVDISGANNATDINNAIALDPTYLSSGTTILVSIVGDLIIALITKASTSQIASLASGTIVYPPYPFLDLTGNAFFSCTIPAPQPKRKKKRTGFGVNNNKGICINRINSVGQKVNCPDTIPMGNITYVKISEDNKQCCYGVVNPNK